jgi:DNA-binding transcriptional LysR family regulator
MDSVMGLLGAFVVLARELHFGRASAKLYVSQPALSRQIHQLEALMGVELFIRSSRHVELTSAGKRLLEGASSALEIAQLAVADARRLGRGGAGHIRIAMSESSSVNMLPDIVRRHLEKQPQIVLSVDHVDEDLQPIEIRERRLHVGFTRSPSNLADLAVEPISEDPFFAVLPKNHRLAANSVISLDQLARENFILWPRSLAPGVFDTVIEACAGLGFKPTILEHGMSALTKMELVAQGIGISLTLMHRLDIHGGVKVVRISNLVSCLYMAWRSDAQPPVTTFTAMVQDLSIENSWTNPARKALEGQFSNR